MINLFNFSRFYIYLNEYFHIFQVLLEFMLSWNIIKIVLKIWLLLLVQATNSVNICEY